MHTPPLSRSVVDRDHLGRVRPGGAVALLADPATAVLLIQADRVPIRDTDEGPAIEYVAPDAMDDVPEAAADAVTYLGTAPEPGRGLRAGARIVAVPVPLDVPPPAATIWRSLREVGAALDALDAGLATEAIAMMQWHETSRFSPVDGSATTTGQSGWVRVDAQGAQHFPRTDPAVIVLITDDSDRILLGRNVAWPEDRFSLFAGFVEPGESLEAAVAREVFEEAGVRVDEIRYLGSQPWPFPRSLMVGFIARAVNPDEVAADADEIAEIRWFTRADLAAGRGFTLPGRSSIARSIVEEWYGGPLSDGRT